MAKRTDRHDTTWPLAPHTKAKHELLRHYLGAWFPMLSKYQKRVVVLDGFAGPGIYDEGEPGSPQIVLTTLLDHSYSQQMTDREFILVFNEQDTERYETLETVMEDLKRDREGLPAHVTLILENESFPDLAEQIIEALADDRLAPTFAFLDPFGYRDISMDTIRRLLAFDRCELFIYFDYNSVNRFSTSGQVDDALEALFGTDEFLNAPPSGDPRRGQFLHDLYQRQLHEAGGFEYVRSFEMVNAKGRTGNYLFFCTGSLPGLNKMKQAMWKVAPAGNYTFDDRKVGQSSLFEEVDTGPLRDALLEHFAGQTIPIQAIIDYTIEHTPYVSTHVKKRTLKPMEDGGLITASGPGKRRKGTYKDGTQVTFPLR